MLTAGKKYNLSKVVANFIGELKENVSDERLMEWMGVVEDIGKIMGNNRGKKDTINSLTLYLK